jgi:HlyD family secretion protein
VQVRSLVDETDIGKLQPGMPATLSVDAYPDRRFEGSVLKIEPLATVQQNVTMFPVLVRLANPGHLLKPGMTTEVEIHVGRRENVLAIPYAALRTTRDVASAASVLGLDPKAVQAELAGSSAPPESARAGEPQATPQAARKPDTVRGAEASTSGERPAGERPSGERPAGERPAGERPSGQAASGRVPRGSGQGDSSRGGPGRRGASSAAGSPASYIVFVLREGKPVPVRIRTGLTDLDYVEVLEGLQEGDSVLVLPSASLVNSQREMQERFQRMTGGGLPGVQQQQPQGGQRSGGSR